jgi:hypothetical protein
MAAALADPHFGPSRAEGFAAICAVVPTHHNDLAAVLQAELVGLDQRIRSATNRERKLQRHGYSRLLDLERLLYLIRLLSTWPDLEASDPASAEELEAILSPLPQGDLADRAAAFLGKLHGACFADASAIRNDLAWLEANGFCSAVPTDASIQLAPAPRDAGPVHGNPQRLGLVGSQRLLQRDPKYLTGSAGATTACRRPRPWRAAAYGRWAGVCAGDDAASPPAAGAL